MDYATGSYPLSVFVSDVDGDGDGDGDIVTANGNGNSVSVIKNNGDGTFAAKVDYATGSSPISVFVSDVDGDGDWDIVVANQWDYTVSVLKNLNSVVLVVPPPAPGDSLDWNDSTIWGGGHIPSADDTVMIPANYTINLNTDNLNNDNSSIGTLIVNDSANIVISGQNTLNISNDFVIGGNVTIDTSQHPTIQVQGNFLLGSLTDNAGSASFHPGSSTIVMNNTRSSVFGFRPGQFGKTGTPQPLTLYNLTINGDSAITSGNVVVSNVLQLNAQLGIGVKQTNKASTVYDTLIITNSSPTAVRGNGVIRNGAMRRRFVQSQPGKTALKYQFHSPNTAIEIDSVGTYPSTITMTKFADESRLENTYLKFKGGTVDTLNNFVRVTGIRALSKWVFGQVGHKAGDSTVGPVIEITPTDDATAKGIGNAEANVYSAMAISLSYDPTALKGIPEDSLGLLKTVSLLKIKSYADDDGSNGTTNDRTEKPWGVKVYQNSVLPNNLVGSASNSVDTMEDIGAGSFVVVAYDSSDWNIIQHFTNQAAVSDTAHRVTIVLAEGREDSVTFIHYADPTLFRTIKASTSLYNDKPAKLKYKSGKLVGTPNWGTVLTEVFQKIGKGGATFLGIEQTVKDSAKRYGWITYKKATDLAKLYTRSHGGQYYPIDSLRVSAKVSFKPLRGKVTKAFGTNYDNPAWEQAITLKLNIIASDFSVTPPGLGALVIDTSFIFTPTGKQLKGMTVAEFAKYVDSVMTYYQRYNVVSSAGYGALGTLVENIIRPINNAFSVTALDTSNYILDSAQIASKNDIYAISLKGIRSAGEVSLVKRVRGKTSEPFVTLQGNTREPEAFSLEQNYPNPFNPTTAIQFTIADDARVSLTVYNVLGQEVMALLNNEEVEGGEHEVQFDASGLSSGVYFYRIDVARNGITHFTQTKKLLLMK